MVNNVSELLNFTVSLEREVDAKQEWKEIQQSNKMVFVKLHDIRDRQWLPRHKALFFKGELVEWEGKERDSTLSGHNTYSFCLPLFLAWYFHENGSEFLNAVRASILKRNETLDQIQRGRILVNNAGRSPYHKRPYGMFGPATPGIVDLFFEGDPADRYEKSVEYGDYVASMDREAMRSYFSALGVVLYGASEGAEWLPGRFRRTRALLASHKESTYMHENVVSVISYLKKPWAIYRNGERDYSQCSTHLMALIKETDRQLCEDIQAGALSGWVADLLIDGINI